MQTKQSRIVLERQSVRAMIFLYCRSHHGKKGALCAECTALLKYAQERLAACRYQQNKPTCGKCPIHCYKPSMRTKIKAVMRYAGPRMLWHHPILAIRHIKDRLRNPPSQTTGR